MTKKFKVIYVGDDDGYHAAKDELIDIAETVHIASESDSISQELLDADALLDASMKVKITNNMAMKAKNLRIISCATTGSDHIERDNLKQRNIPVLTLKEDRALLNNLTPAAELSWALLMACARKLVPAVEHVRSGQWEREKFPGIMLNGKQIGIIGCGRIGGWMARYAHAFGMDVVGYDPYLAALPDGISKVTLQEMFATSQFISIHVHLSEETTSLVSAGLLANANPGLILINTSRGAIIDQDALLKELISGRLGGVGLDVLMGEPEINEHPLVEYTKSSDNLLITPHYGGYSPDAVKIVCEHAAKKIKIVLTAKI